MRVVEDWVIVVDVQDRHGYQGETRSTVRQSFSSDVGLKGGEIA